MRKRLITGLAALVFIAPLVNVSLAAPPVDTPLSRHLTAGFASVDKLPGISTSELQAQVARFSSHFGAANTVAAGRLQATQKLVVSSELNSELVLVAAQWPVAGPQPIAALGRYLRGEIWSDWEAIGDEFLPSANGETMATEAWIVTAAQKAEIALVVEGEIPEKSVWLEVIDPGTRNEDREYAQVNERSLNRLETTNNVGTKQTFSVQGTPTAAWTDVPASGKPVEILSRADWGANEYWMKWTPKAGKIQGAVVHHTAGANDYTAEQVPGIIRSIYYYHAVSQGWGDIGYNVLVDNFGRAWQGRSGDIWRYNTVAGHASGVNSTTFGISVLGNYSQKIPSAAALDTVARVIAFKLSATKLDPLNTKATVYSNGRPLQVPVVSGHRDVGATACPGDAFYAYLPTLREQIAQYRKSGTQTVVKPDYVLQEEAQMARGVPVRLAGNNRVETSLEIAKYAFPKGAKTVYVTRADVIADALAGGALTDGPIVLVYNNKNSAAAVAAYIKTTGAKQVIALGGTGSVTTETLQQVAGGKATARLAGRDRTETSAAIARRVHALNPGQKTVYIAEKLLGIDALAAGSLTDGPVMLVPSTGTVPASVQATISALRPTKVVALGGSGAVSEDILKQAAGKRQKGRLGGKNRVETAIVISKYAFPQGANQVYLVSSESSIDAAAGGVLIGGPLLLLSNATKNVMNSQVREEIKRLKPANATAVGGTGVLSSAQLRQALQLARR